MDGSMDRWIDGWMDGSMDPWIDGWMDRWMDGSMDGCPPMGNHTQSGPEVKLSPIIKLWIVFAFVRVTSLDKRMILKVE